jgi:hypothetical protein
MRGIGGHLGVVLVLVSLFRVVVGGIGVIEAGYGRRRRPTVVLLRITGIPRVEAVVVLVVVAVAPHDRGGLV